MNRLDKKQIFIGTILGIILSILTLILFTRNIQPLSAQQTQPRYMIFKTTAGEGFKFMNMNDTRTYVGMRFIGGIPYLATLNATSMLWITVSSSTPGAGFIVLTNRLNPNQQSWIRFATSSFGFFMNNPQLGTTTYARIFAQTPTTNSPGNQVATKEYVDQLISGGLVGPDFQKIQITYLWTDHFIRIVPSINPPDPPYINQGWSAIIFRGAGPNLEWNKNCLNGIGVFPCSSSIILLNGFESNILFRTVSFKSLLFTVTLSGRSGNFVINFCQNISLKGAPDNKLYWEVSYDYDIGGWKPGSNYATLDFAVDRASGAGMAFIQVKGPYIYLYPCNPSEYTYSK